MRGLVFYAFVLAVVASVAVQAQSPAGGEFRINNATATTQVSSAVDADATGRFVVVWSTSGTGGAVRGRRFSPAGVPLAAEFAVSSPAAGAASPAVATDARGRFVVAWEQFDGNGRGIFARRFDVSGYPFFEDPFRVNAYLTGNQDVPSVALLAGGSFVVAWYGASDGDGAGIFARRFDSAGIATLPGDVRVNTATTGFQYGASVVATGPNRYVVVWSGGDDGSSRGVFGQRFDGDTPLGGEFRVNAYTTGNQFAGLVVRGAEGGFVGVWQDGATLWGRRFDASGAPDGGDFIVHAAPTAFPQVTNAAANAAGDFTVVWDTAYAYEVVGRRFAPTGAPRGGVFQANTYTTISLGPLPNVGSDPSGNLVVTWRSDQYPGPGTFSIYGRRYGGLVPAALVVTDGGNGVLEVPDDFALVTSWLNVSGATQAFQGQVESTVVPPGLFLTLSTSATYGSVPNGATGSCTACFAGALVGTRPAGHVDLQVLERIQPDGQGQAKSWAVHIAGSFTDVPRASSFYRFVETLLHQGVTAGCGGNAYCPASSVTREQMAVFLLAAKEGAGYVPRSCTTPVFGDVPAGSPFCRWIEELARRFVTSGCGGGNYCPGAAVSREQMAVFVLRTLDPALTPPACAPPNSFNDVPETSAFCRWIEELARRGVVSGCGGGNYCPTAAVTREQMAVFLTGTFGLTLYGV